ncbi:homeobox protein BEL1 homolog [Cynara cardunculus var. scolymus]|uniref:Homeobox KN domain-containing protein n=1 Tax=Cynara cardunculus var. scolymus TaxID=59895 RepID=A0A118JTT5_CYNCS|nr:homeobox protein BEL1 homolog [Cynara cardunculus var. scolymus]KVH90132.1 Homeobox KN domain-containing protein [Cynara cardunculus var. scolymus]
MAEEEEKIIRGNDIMVGSSTGNYNCYTDDHHVNSSSNHNPTTSFETSPLEMFNFESHNPVSHHNSVLFWKGPSPPPSSKPITDSISAGDFYHFDESSLQRCVFSCEPNERPSQGLSLSLSSANPSTIGIQPFELARPQEHQYQHHHQQGYFGKSMSIDHDQHHQDMMTQDGFLGKPGNIINSGSDGGEGSSLYNHHQSAQYNIRSSRYLVPAQELLNEFCNLGSKQHQSDQSPKAKAAATTSNQWQDHDNMNNATSSKTKSLSSLEFMELQKRKTKLLQMLEEVDRRYKHYCDQMKAVVSSFEAVAGNGAAKVYSSLASKAMSRHFRCLRDSIVSQMKTTKVAMGEKDVSAPGTSRGETPRLRVLDQTLRQQRAFQQMTMMDSHPWRPQRGLPERSVSVLRAWLFEHFLHPYPNDVDKHILARQTGLSRSQVSNWFINARVRLWKPMVEEMYVEETKTNQETMEGTSDGFNPNPQMDQKPTADELVRIDSECLSSIINHPEKMDHHRTKTQDHDFHHSFSRVTNSFGAVELDFSSYNNHHNFGGGGDGGGGTGGVSLTLGLQQHGGGNGTGGGGGGVSLAFSPTSQNSLFYPRDHIEDCQTAVQYSSLLEGDDQGQNLPYRNLMGAQLLHDLAG